MASSLTKEEQFDALNCIAFRDALQTKIGSFWAMLYEYTLEIPEAYFEIDGVPVRLIVEDDKTTTLKIGTNDGTNWQYTLPCPQGWYKV